MAKMYKAHIRGPPQDVILIACPPSHDQQGRKLEATMRALKENFNVQALYLADTLNAHNTGSSEIARRQGDAWLDRHGDMLDDLPIIRWDDICSHSDFEVRHREIRRLYSENGTARSAVDCICARHVATVIERLLAQGVEPDEADLMRRSVNYMLEEIAGLSIIRDMTDAPEVYSGECFADPEIFDRLTSTTLKLPKVLPVAFERVLVQP